MVVKIASYVLAGTILVQVLPAIQDGSWGPVLLLVSTILGSAWKINRELKKIHRNTALVAVEHEMLIIDYCGRQNPPIRPDDLPTRRSPFQGAD